jgi:small subunit ribosomal protein S6
MRSYELMFIVHPEEDDDGLNAVVDRVEGFIERSGGEVVRIEPWGLRRLAYPIQDQWEGQYVLMQLKLDAQSVATLERDIGLVEQIIRHLIVRLEGEVEATESAEEATTAESDA